MSMNPAERYAALKLLHHGIGEAVKAAAVEAETYRAAVKAKSLETPWGTVSITRRKPTVAIVDEAVFLDWVKTTAPHLVEERVSEVGRRAILDRLEIVDGEVIDPVSGEAPLWAGVKPGAEFLTARIPSEAKAEAVGAVLARVEGLARVLAITAGEGQA